MQSRRREKLRIQLRPAVDHVEEDFITTFPRTDQSDIVQSHRKQVAQRRAVAAEIVRRDYCGGPLVRRIAQFRDRRDRDNFPPEQGCMGAQRDRIWPCPDEDESQRGQDRFHKRVFFFASPPDSADKHIRVFEHGRDLKALPSGMRDAQFPQQIIDHGFDKNLDASTAAEPPPRIEADQLRLAVADYVARGTDNFLFDAASAE